MGIGRRPPQSFDGRAASLASLLWPPAYRSDRNEPVELPPETIADLDLEPLVRALSGHQPRREPFVRSLLTTLCTAPEVITYRQQVLTNLLEELDLRERLTGLMAALAPLMGERTRALFQTEWSVSEVVARLGELELYVDAVLSVGEALDT